jgi:predicted nuclease of restriction endonuclease-like (RecB) superfamily
MQSITPEYKAWLGELKLKIRSVQLKAAVAVNAALIEFYWELGKMISEKDHIWGSKLIEQIANDLKEEFPDMKGLSRRNLFNIKKFYEFYAPIVQQPVALLKNSAEPKIVQQAVALSGQQNETNKKAVELLNQNLLFQIPWGHNILIFTKSNDAKEARFYLEQTVAGHWSRDVLALQIKSGLYRRQGKAVNNFKDTMSEPMSDLAQQTLKDPYIFDFMTMAGPYKEKNIEEGLIEHVSKFLLELGKGFAFVGRQYHLEIADNDYYLDLLFYHTRLKCYVVIELKNTKFMPEYTGKLNFYLSAVDTLLKQADDNATIGILLCRDKNNVEAEFALRGINKPMGVSEFEITESLPDNLKGSLPTIEELENELAGD